MDRYVDAAAVLLFVGATAFVGLYARGFFDRHGEPTPETEPPPRTSVFALKVEEALPTLEGHVVAGSWKPRDARSTCAADERRRIAELDAIERDLFAAELPSDRALAEPVAEALAALRMCVSCAPEKNGCAAAARALTRVESRLGLPRSAGGI